MDFSLSEERKMLQETVARFFENNYKDIKNSFSENTKRVWVHTCSLDHKNALNNYISRGMRIYKTESISI